MARTSFIDAISWSKLLIPRPAPVPGDAEHRNSTLPRLCSWDLRSFRVERAQAEERHQERLRLREAGETERVYRALDRERAEKRRAEVEAGLFWPRSATGQLLRLVLTPSSHERDPGGRKSPCCCE